MSSDAVPDHGSRPDLRARRRATYRADLQSIAVELCLEHGYDAVSTRRIAHRAGVSESTLFRSFGSKAGLICRNPFLPKLVESLSLPFDNPTLPVREVLKRAIAATVDDITPEQWAEERRRRTLLRREPELQLAAGAELDAAASGVRVWLAARLGNAVPDRVSAAYAAFLAAGFSTVAFTDEPTAGSWGRELVTIVELISTGISL